jgi:hypothetical protein
MHSWLGIGRVSLSRSAHHNVRFMCRGNQAARNSTGRKSFLSGFQSLYGTVFAERRSQTREAEFSEFRRPERIRIWEGADLALLCLRSDRIVRSEIAIPSGLTYTDMQGVL